MPVFSSQTSFRPVGVRASGGIRPSGEVDAPFRARMAGYLGLSVEQLPPIDGGGPPLGLTEAMAKEIVKNTELPPADLFRQRYCQLPPGGFATRAEMDAYNAARPWCPPATDIGSASGARETFRIRLGLDATRTPTPLEVSDAAIADLLAQYPSGPVGDADLRQKFQSIYCALPSPMPTDRAAIDAWNASHRWCTPIPYPVAVVPSTGGRARLQAQLGLPSLPSVVDLTDATADALLALPSAQMVDAFRARFCNPPAFATNAARDLWVSNHPWCPNPPSASVTRSPIVWIAGAVVGAGGIYWLLKKKKSKKAK